MSSFNNVFSFNKHIKQQQRQQIQVVSRQFIQYICAVGKYLDQPAQSHILSMAHRYTSDISMGPRINGDLFSFSHNPYLFNYLGTVRDRIIKYQTGILQVIELFS